MKNSKKKKKQQNNKFGVFNGNVINSETLGYDQEFEIENYQDESLIITEIKKQHLKEKKPEINNKNKKGKANYFIYKLTAYIIILLLIVLLIVWLVVK
ncbi:hypothetical protein [Spiroplasma floricola]|uniref:Transmembrane protein n=1 Tax=Spiroplasma floricola 23-6 TaxID=1336749 RepID=A0A2K8SF50_9MOLU|nr:hypothetical protein [Spiroplasma floricola]AUB31975.1 hypothetical protein SFLOR_v1c09270 [Spiroplasma floricola 23-6]